jgi:glycosyltransferase involved in cell wall biosynthesis
MRVAIVHDYLTQYGGAERVVEALAELFPDAPIYTLFYDPQKTRGKFEGRVIRESFWARVPIMGTMIRNHNQLFFWLLPLAVARFDLRGYDLVISSSATFSKGALKAPGALHICYCHTPTRYLWDDLGKYVTGFYANPFVRLVGSAFLGAVRRWDSRAATRPDIFVANSRHTAEKIKAAYRREPKAVIYPPVDVGWWRDASADAPQASRTYLLMVGRMLAYKRFDVGIEVSRRLGMPLKIVGEGREMARLKKHAPSTVEFLGWVPDRELATLYANARALLMPQSEDFGIVAVEALACGTPVVTYRESGAAEIVADGENGVLVDRQTPEAFADALRRLERLEMEIAPQAIRASAERFSKERFKRELMALIKAHHEDRH